MLLGRSGYQAMTFDQTAVGNAGIGGEQGQVQHACSCGNHPIWQVGDYRWAEVANGFCHPQVKRNHIDATIAVFGK